MVELNIERLLKNEQDERLASTLKDSMDSKEIWNIFLNFNEEFQFKFYQQVAKKTERIIKLDKTKSKECAQYLADYCTYFSFTTRNKKVLLEDFDNFPERSILREAFSILKNSKNKKLRKIILENFVGLKKNEKELRLPEINWYKFNFDKEGMFFNEILLISLEQGNLKMIHNFIKKNNLKITKEIEKSSGEALRQLSDILDVKAFRDLVVYLIKSGGIRNEIVFKVLKELSAKRFDVKVVFMLLMENDESVYNWIDIGGVTKDTGGNVSIQSRTDKHISSEFKNDIFWKVYDVPGVLDRLESSKINFLKELLKKERIELGTLIENYSNDRDLCFFTSWMRTHVSEDVKIRLLKKLAQIGDKVEGQVVFELLVGLVSALGANVRFPVEIGDYSKLFVLGSETRGRGFI